MTDPEITALAREYAEEIYNNIEDERIRKPMIDSLAKGTEDSFRFMLRRFCLVEKSKLREAYKDAQKDQHNPERDFALTLAGRNRSSVLIELFPDLTWDDEPQEYEIIIKRKRK